MSRLHHARCSGPDLVWPLLALSVGWWIYGLPSMGWFTAIPGDLGDARFNSVILEHVYRWLCGQEPHLWSPRFFYPFEGALAFSDNHFGSVWSYALARWVGLEREQSFDAWYTCGLALNLICAHRAARGFGLSPASAAVTGFVFTFALPVLAQEGHAQLNYRFALPLAVLAYWRLRTQPRIQDLCWLLIWWALQFFCSIYLGMLLSLLLVSLTALSWRKPETQALLTALSPHRWPPQHALPITALACIALLAIALLAAMLLTYHDVSSLYGFKRPRGEIRSMLPRLGSYLLADHSTYSAWLGHWIQDIPMRHEHQLSLGLGAWALLMLAMVMAWRTQGAPDWAKPMAWCWLVLALLTLYGWGLSLYAPMMYLPGFNAIRAVTRIILVMLWPMALLIGLLVHRMPAGVLQPHGWALISLMLLAVVDVASYQSHSTPIRQWQARQEALALQYNRTHHDNPIILVRRPDHEPAYLSEIDAMIFAQDRSIQTVNGYSGNTPHGMVDATACTPSNLRLLDFARFKGLPSSHIDPLSQRILVLNALPCRRSMAGAKDP